MIIYKEPEIDPINRTFKVSYNIDTNEDTLITVNGLLSIMNDDIEDISGNVITIKQGVNIDYENDTFAVIYTKLN